MAKKATIELAAQHGETLVYHAVNYPLAIGISIEEECLTAQYDLVAGVFTENPEVAFTATQHLPTESYDGPKAFAYVKEYRSTSVGDVVVTPDGQAYLCLNFGWKAIKSAS